MPKIIVKVDGMSCSACSNKVEKYLNKQENITKAIVNLVMGTANITYNDAIDINDIKKYIEEAGYDFGGIYNPKVEEKNDNSIYLVIIMIVLGIILMYIAMGSMLSLPSINTSKYPKIYALILLILTIPFLGYGFDILKKGIKNIWHKAPNMDSLVTIGVMASFLYSLYGLIMIFLGYNHYVHNLYFESSAIVLLFIKIGRFIDQKVSKKTKDAIKELVTITPVNALIKTNEGIKEITIDEVQKGDVLVAKPGMKIAVDGIILEGESHFDEAFITGESKPCKKTVEDNVIAGSINIDGYILYKALKIGPDSTISEIVRLVVEATNTKAPIAKYADKVSGIFVPIIIFLALATLIIYLILGSSFDHALINFVTVLVVACPCALGLATPLAIVVSLGRCAKNNILVKTSETLENVAHIDTIVFDKTGTLTYGDLRIAKIFNYSEYPLNEIMATAFSVENLSTHPIAKAFLKYAKDNNLKISEVKKFQNYAGIGVKGIVDDKEFYLGNAKLLKKLKINFTSKDISKLEDSACSIIYVILNAKVIALIGVKDIIRDNAKITINKLQDLGKEVIMLTGDNYKTAKQVAKTLNITNIKADILPKDKAKIITELLNSNHKVMMVGDGINDAPSLAKATVGVSLTGGTDIANNSADVILTNADLEKIITLIIISQKTLRNIKQNLFWAFLYNILMIPIAMGLFSRVGLTMNPMFASFAMTISSLTVVINALRLKKVKIN